jgi:hypothetical protein
MLSSLRITYISELTTYKSKIQKGKVRTGLLKKDPCKAPASNLDFMYLNIKHICIYCILKILKWKIELRKRKCMIGSVE